MSKTSYTTTAPPNIPTPQSLDAMPYWGMWKRENGTKVPVNPRTRNNAKPNDPRTFGTRAQAERELAIGAYEGLCVLVDASIGVTMIDFDHVIPEEHAGDETQIPPDVRRIVRMANTYTTWSPSRTGIRMFCAATTGRDYENKNHGRKVCIAEQYNAVRFATVMTNDPISNTPDNFNDNRDDLVAVLKALDFKRRAAKRPPQPKPAYVGGSHTASEIIETASRVNGAKFCRLHAGDISGYPESQTDKGFSSEADAAYVLILCGYTGDDAQVANIWRSESRLHRKKLGREDYVARTIASARTKQSWWYEWDRPTGPILITRGDTPIQHHAFGHESAGDGGPESHSEGDTCSAQLAEARREIVALKQDRDALIALVLNPHVSVTEKMAVAATIDRATRTPAGEDGFVTIKPAEIANDWRPKPERGQNTTPLNRDGSKPRMPRATVRKTMLTLTQYGLNAHSKKEDVKPKGKGREPYKETVWRVRPPANMSEFLAPIAMYQPTTITPRKARTIAPQCSECGVDLDVTTWTVTEMACPECGEVHRTESAPRTLAPVVTIDPATPRPRLKDNLSPWSGGAITVTG